MRCLLFILPALCAFTPAAGADTPPDARANAPTAFTAGAPVRNFEVATFTPAGHRSWLLRGTAGHYVSQDEIQVTNLNLTVFAGDSANHIDSIFLSPSATAYVNRGQVRGDDSVRVITNDFEATGRDWLYDHRQKRVSIRKDVRVVFHAQLIHLLR